MHMLQCKEVQTESHAPSESLRGRCTATPTGIALCSRDRPVKASAVRTLFSTAGRFASKGANGLARKISEIHATMAAVALQPKL